MEGMAPGRRYFPAAGRDAFLPLYDPFTRLFGLQRVLTMLVNQAGLQRNYRVLDVGCGTGTLAVLVKHRHPEVAIVGLDPDLEGAGARAAQGNRCRSRREIRAWVRGRAAARRRHVRSRVLVDDVPSSAEGRPDAHAR